MPFESDKPAEFFPHLQIPPHRISAQSSRVVSFDSPKTHSPLKHCYAKLTTKEPSVFSCTPHDVTSAMGHKSTTEVQQWLSIPAHPR